VILPGVIRFAVSAQDTFVNNHSNAQQLSEKTGVRRNLFLLSTFLAATTSTLRIFH
jgi:hypothetical protein